MTSDQKIDALTSGMTSIIGRLSRLDTYAHAIPVDVAGEVDAVHYLRSQLTPAAYIPPAGGWAAQYKTIAWLVAQILESRIEGLVLELGGGVSTVWLGLALRRRGEGALVSLDHDDDYANKTRRGVEQQGLQSYVSVLHTPLATQEIRGESRVWYDLASLEVPDSSVGLLFVDGPPATSEPLARDPAFVMLRSKLRDGALVVLDDVDRPGEQQILENWTAAAASDGSTLSHIERLGRSVVLRFDAAQRNQTPPQSL
ncbi:class I SAM-dependent methyltransferase [Terrabacter sp. NPDC000476]|uniref:class I SAM-dependent methyltransferase n=1 Tax=Terrabacter sp. NPDC000476 TaxID=3154258 RepID=UPI003320450F